MLSNYTIKTLSQSYYNDAIDSAVIWDQDKVPFGKTVRLKFNAKNAKLLSYWFKYKY